MKNKKKEDMLVKLLAYLFILIIIIYLLFSLFNTKVAYGPTPSPGEIYHQEYLEQEYWDSNP